MFILIILKYKKMPKKVKIQNVLNRRTDFLVTIIELLSFLIRPDKQTRIE